MTTNDVCPVCNGSCKVPLTERDLMWFKDDYPDGMRPCRNCGGQYQRGKPTGTVSLRKDGTPCKHSYMEHRVNTYTTYTCVHCNDVYSICSSD